MIDGVDFRSLVNNSVAETGDFSRSPTKYEKPKLINTNYASRNNLEVNKSADRIESKNLIKFGISLRKKFE